MFFGMDPPCWLPARSRIASLNIDQGRMIRCGKNQERPWVLFDFAHGRLSIAKDQCILGGWFLESESITQSMSKSEGQSTGPDGEACKSFAPLL
jgi:hypothetical protein